MSWPSDLGLSPLSFSGQILAAIYVGMFIGAIYDLLDLEISYWVAVKSVFCCFDRLGLSWEEQDLILSRWSSWSLDPSLIPFRLMGTMQGEIMYYLYQLMMFYLRCKLLYLMCWCFPFFFFNKLISVSRFFLLFL